MKGVTLAGGGVALVKLASHDFPPSHTALVVVALFGVFLTYYGQSVGLTIVHLRPSFLDISLPMLLTVAEFFIIIRPGSPPDGDLPTDWFYAFAIWAILAAIIVASVICRIKSSSYVAALWPVAANYKSELKRDVINASGLAIITVGFAIAYSTLNWGTTAEYVFLAVILAALIGAIGSQGKARRELARRLAMPV